MAERIWRKTDGSRYRALDLRAHEILRGVPVHDTWEVDLPGGGAGRTVADVWRLLALTRVSEANRAVGALFALRSAMGRWFGWDRDASVGRTVPDDPWPVPESLVAASTIPVGAGDGPFPVLYATEAEVVSEIRNATVHAFSVFALEPVEAGYRGHWGIYVKPVGAITAFYMALIAPFRRFIVYPAVLNHVNRTWQAEFDAGS